MDPFQSLPTLVLDLILGFLPDLSSLHSLHNASPAIASVLHEDGVAPTIIEAIISQLPFETQALIRAVALLRWQSSFACTDTMSENRLPSTLAAFSQPFDRVDSSRPRNNGYSDARLPKSTPPSIVCHLIALYARVHRLTHDCLHDLIARSLILKPERLVNPRFRYRWKPTFETRQPRPHGQPYRPVDTGPLSWVEEQRTLMAMWRLVLFFQLRDVVFVRGFGWSAEDVRMLQNLNTEAFWEELLTSHSHYFQELMTVADWIHSKGTAATVSVSEGKNLPPWIISPMDLNGKWVRCCEVFKPATVEEWTKAKKCLSSENRGHYFASTTIKNYPSSPLRYVDISVFRPYGFMIWDTKRMIALGFLESCFLNDVDPVLIVSESNAMFAWLSILTKNQLEEVERRQRENWTFPEEDPWDL